jgi:hypothetical protein
MLVPSSIIGRVLTGVGCTALLSGVVDALGMGPAVCIAYVLLASAWMMSWRPRDALVVARAPRALEPRHFPRLARSQDASSPEQTSGSGRLLAFPDQRTVWSRVKISVGTMGLGACALWWMLLTAMLVMPDPATALDELFTTSFLPIVMVSLLLPVLFLVFLRSGLRGPTDPFVPDWRPSKPADTDCSPEHARRAGRGVRRGKKSHLRIVRDTTF